MVFAFYLLASAATQLLVQRGYTVIQVDVRGSTGNGRRFREEFVADAGGRDLEDLVATAAYARTLPSVATGRVGVWGSSYGGLITLMALFKHPGVFQAGVAAAPAVLASFYGPDDTAVVRRPAGARGEPDANYAKNSPLTFSSGLEDPLLLIHGMQDDIVPFKTTMMLMEKLMEEGKTCFELATAAAATHNWAAVPHVAEYLYGRLMVHFDRHLLGMAAPKL
jgi:dipeptidyl-peptidase-4